MSQVTIYNGKGYRCNVSKPASDPMIRQDQCLFVVGHQLDSAEEALALKEALRSTTSVMKAILNIDGKGEFEPGVKQPLVRYNVHLSTSYMYRAFLTNNTWGEGRVMEGSGSVVRGSGGRGCRGGLGGCGGTGSGVEAVRVEAAEIEGGGGCVG